MNNKVFPEYAQFIASCMRNDFSDNYDHRRFGPLSIKSMISKSQVHLKDLIRFIIKECLRRVSIYRSPSDVDITGKWMAPNVENLKWVYDHLVDNESKQLLIQILAYRALGYRRVKLPLNNTNYWNYYQQADDLISGAESVDIGFNGWRAYRLRLDKFGYPMEVFMRPGGVMTQMILQQYRCKSDEHIIEASEGDVVIDGGGCFGDTALYFAHKVGDKGRVYSFEFLPVNLMIFNRNLQLNPSHAKRIKVIPHPLWSKSGESLFVEANGPATRIKAFSNNPQAMQVETLSIDDLVKIERINRLDFIKMDIEGAELAALKGAEQSIKRFRPKLAISVYHNLQDFWEIPQWIQGLSLGYRFHLRHFTIHQEETVIYADVAR